MEWVQTDVGGLSDMVTNIHGLAGLAEVDIIQSISGP